MNFELIQATEYDKPYILSLRKLTMVEHLEKSGLFLSEEDHKSVVNDSFECFHIIVCEKKIIGAIKFQEYYNKLKIMQLQIHPNFQRKGFGKKIMEEMLNNFKPKNFELTVLKENPALKFYIRLGFKIIDENEYEFHMRAKH